WPERSPRSGGATTTTPSWSRRWGAAAGAPGALGAGSAAPSGRAPRGRCWRLGRRLGPGGGWGP
ncbi:MAG: hypothetical protein AVDCRST_MAG02-1240, partial [uncultured Rubrobacteraceae bacterium]